MYVFDFEKTFFSKLLTKTLINEAALWTIWKQLEFSYYFKCCQPPFYKRSLCSILIGVDSHYNQWAIFKNCFKF